MRQLAQLDATLVRSRLAGERLRAELAQLEAALAGVDLLLIFPKREEGGEEL